MITKYDKLISDDLANRLYEYGLSIAKGEEIKEPIRHISTNLAWPSPLRIGSGLVLCIRPTEEMEKEIENILVEKGVLDFTIEKPITTTATTVNIWGRGSLITSHPDTGYSKAITVYLNPNWKYNDGGIFHWKDGDSWNAIAPTFNTAVLVEEGTPHGVSPVQSDFRITLQIFVHKAG
jgi:hypothetical protein